MNTGENEKLWRCGNCKEVVIRDIDDFCPICNKLIKKDDDEIDRLEEE